MPDTPWRPPNPLEDPDAWYGDGIVVMEPGETSIRVAKARLYGEPKPRPDPSRERVRCQADAIAAVPSCWHEAFETVVDNLGDGYDLCPEHAAEARDAIRELQAEEASEAIRQGVYTQNHGDGLGADEDGDPDAGAIPERAARPVPAAYTPEAFRAVTEDNRAKRYSDRKARGIPTTNVIQTRSKLGSTREYQRIERRRWRARQKGLDPDTLGSAFRLPRRTEHADPTLYRRLIDNAQRALSRLPDVPEDDED
jgi:hypothetical protein